MTALLLFANVNVFSTIWHVNNVGGLFANFTTIQAAHNAATAGDTLYVYGSATNYESYLSLSKPLTIIGPGYLLNENQQTQANFTPATVNGEIYFRQNSGGSIIMGLTMYSLHIRTSNITLKRNKINFMALNDTPSTTFGISNIIITQNYFDPGFATAVIFTTANNQNGASNVVISNNIIFGGLNLTFGSNYNIFNNYFSYVINIKFATYRNNIQSNYNTINGSTNSSFNNVIMQNNVFSGRTYMTGSTETPIDSILNKVNITNMANVFTQVGSSDGKYQLKTTSPAIGFAYGGGDCGPFGGPSPYVLSGMPNIPAVYELNVPPAGGSNLNITIKAKSHQ